MKLLYSSLTVALLLQGSVGSQDFACAASDEQQDPVLDAWGDFQNATQELKTIMTNSPFYDIDPYGAYTLLQYFTRDAMDAMSEAGGDGMNPHFTHAIDPDRKMGIDNPDTFYRRAFLQNDSGEEVYVITGKRGTTCHFVVQTFEATDQTKGAVLEDNDIWFGPEGEFRIILSAQKPAPYERNWLELPAGFEGGVIVRNTFCDWQNGVAGSVNIERAGTAGEPSDDRTLTSLQKRIEHATKTFSAQGKFWANFGLNFKNDASYIRKWANTEAGLPTQFNALGYFHLEEGKAIIVTASATDAAYHGFQISDVWATTPDWPNRQVSLSWGNEGSQAYKSSDGKYHFVLSNEDPGVENWIDASGLSQGLIAMRMQGKSTAAEEHPQLQVIDFDKIRTALPDDMPDFDEHKRKRQLLARQAHVQRRYINW